MLDNIVGMVMDVNAFDYLSKIIIDLYQIALPTDPIEVIKILTQGKS